MRMSANTDRVMYSPTAQTPWAVITVHAFPATRVMDSTAKVSSIDGLIEAMK